MGLALASLSSVRANEGEPRRDQLPLPLAIEALGQRWTASEIPVRFCTYQTNRERNISAEQLREQVQTAAQIWNAAGAAVSIQYDGDCATGDHIVKGNGVNEIAFDDELAGTSIGGRAHWFWRGDFFTEPIFC